MEGGRISTMDMLEPTYLLRDMPCLGIGPCGESPHQQRGSTIGVIANRRAGPKERKMLSYHTAPGGHGRNSHQSSTFGRKQ